MKDEIFSMGRQSGRQMSKTVHGFLILETFEQFDLDPVMDKLWSVLNNFDLFGTEHYETAFIYFNFVIDFELDYKDTYEDIQACFNISSFLLERPSYDGANFETIEAICAKNARKI